jgi:hypothetical protein
MPKNINKSKLSSKLKKASTVPTSVMKQAFDYFKKLTPVKTGNAKRSTVLKNNEILAEYEYAPVLDKGRHMTNRGMRGSKQAPKGMSGPTIQRFKAWVAQAIRLGK